MSSRPESLGLEFKIESIDQADEALYELGWLLQQSGIIDAKCRQVIETTKAHFDEKRIVDIEGTPVPFGERIDSLRNALESFTVAHIEEHLEDKRKVTLKHGKLGFQQIPRAVTIATDDETQKPFPGRDVVDWIRNSGWIRPAIQQVITKTTTSVHLSGAEQALDAERITVDELWQVGIDVIDPYDVPVVEPAEIPVVSEA